ncbi:MAG: cyclase family protein [Firmicutes bacterium]|nr:cyclase family protein [Bacillota bacterium]
MQLVDLSVWVNTETYGPPSTHVKVKMDPNYRGPNYWVASSLIMSIHTGSHIDAPSHVFSTAKSVDQYSLADLAAHPVVVPLRHVGESQGVTPEDLQHAPIGAGDIVLLNTGWSDEMWGKFPDYYVRSPYLTPEAAQYLADKRIRAVGFDFFEEYAARLPEFTSDDFVVHHILLGADVVLMEQMTHIDQVSASDWFLAVPLKFQYVEGAPARFMAIKEGA